MDVTVSDGCRPYPHLNDDILLEISSYLPLWKGISPLSQSCKSIRELIKPLLFYAIHIDSACLLAPVIPEELPPPLIRPFARTIVFRGMLRAPYFTLDYIDSPMDQVARSLTEFLNDLPLLHAITFKYTYSCGVPWKLLESMFSVPRLRSFQLLDRIPRDEPVPDDLWFSIAPKLEHFCYIDPRDYRAHPRYTAVEVALLLSVVTQASDSLHTLAMSAEAAPSLKVFSQLVWPHLRELRLKGERPQGWQAPIVPALAGLRALDTLVLELALPLGTKPQLLWQEEIETALPWPALKTFSVTYPHPDDEIYSHLPSTLRTLALRCWPRHYIIREWSDISMEDTLRWHSPVLRASELLSICRRIQSNHMADLDIEYEQDQQEEELLHFLPYAYPNLTKLTLHRYRLPEEGDIDVTMVGRALSPLSNLHTLRIYFDHKLASFRGYDDWPTLSVLRKTLDAHAEYLCHALPSSLRFICLLWREGLANKWIVYHVITGSDNQRAVFEDDVLARNMGLVILDPNTPSAMQLEELPGWIL